MDPDSANYGSLRENKTSGGKLVRPLRPGQERSTGLGGGGAAARAPEVCGGREVLPASLGSHAAGEGYAAQSSPDSDGPGPSAAQAAQVRRSPGIRAIGARPADGPAETHRRTRGVPGS